VEWRVGRGASCIDGIEGGFSLPSSARSSSDSSIDPPSHSLSSQLLVQAIPAELEPVLSMYLTLLEETQSSLTFKVWTLLTDSRPQLSDRAICYSLLPELNMFHICTHTTCDSPIKHTFALSVAAEQGSGGSASLHRPTRGAPEETQVSSKFRKGGEENCSLIFVCYHQLLAVGEVQNLY